MFGYRHKTLFCENFAIPHDIFTELLSAPQATSELEAKEANYLSVRLANDGAIQEKLDLARIAAARSSSMMECVTQVHMRSEKWIVFICKRLRETSSVAVGTSSRNLFCTSEYGTRRA